MRGSTAEELAVFSNIIDEKASALLRQAAKNYRHLQAQGLDEAARLFRQRAIEIVSGYIEDAMQEARGTSYAFARLLDDIEGEQRAL